jgi:hypothetical protein
VEIASGKCLLLPGDNIIPNNLTMPKTHNSLKFHRAAPRLSAQMYLVLSKSGFTDINKTISLGLSANGSRWGRPDDTVGVAMAVNGASGDARRFFGAGGLGILVGDGQLIHSGAESILETYYSVAVFTFAKLSLDYQFVDHPAYNRDRGPVSIFGFRAHGDFDGLQVTPPAPSLPVDNYLLSTWPSTTALSYQMSRAAPPASVVTCAPHWAVDSCPQG